MAEPRTRPPTGEFGESLTETGTNWWDLPIAGGGGGGPGRPSGPAPATYTGKPFVTEGRQGVWNDPDRRSGGMRPPGGTGLSPAMEGAVAAFRPSGGGGLSKADIFSLGLDRVDRGKSFKNIRKEKEAARILEEKWQLEKDKWEEKKKQFQEQLAVAKMQVRKPVWGI